LAEEEEEKKEEQYGIGRTGDLEWISLEQAGVLAMRTAREAPGNYGRSFSSTLMVFDVTEEEDGEDYYIITLSFRPEGDFDGTPGQEQFFIEKEGSVAVRQVRSLPTRQGQRRFPWIPVVIALAVVAVIAGIVGVVFALPGGDDGDGVTVRPGQPARLESPQGDVTVDLATGSVDRPVRLEYRALALDEVPPLPEGFTASEKLFDLSVTGAQMPETGRFLFSKPVSITVRLDAEHAMRANGIEANLVIQHFNEARGEWTPLPTTVDFNASTARAQVDSLSIFALTVKEPGPTTAQPTDTPTPTDPPTTALPSFELKVNGRPVTGPSVATTNATVSVSPPPNAPNNRYITGTEVNITLSPTTGYTGSCDTSSIIMTSDLEVGCSMSREAYTLSILGMPVTGPSLTMAEGTVSLSPAPNAPGNQYNHGTVVNLSLTPASGFIGFCDILAVTMTSDRDVSCTLTQQSHVLTIDGVQVRAGQTMVEVANGEIDLSEAPGSDGRYAENVEVFLSAFPYSEGATILWDGVDTEGFDFATVQMDRDRFVTVEFVPVDRHGDSIDTATPISLGLTSGAIDPPGDLDFFRYSAQSGTTYIIEVILDTHPDTVLTLYDSRGNWLDEDDDEGRGGGELLEVTAPFTGDYYVEVRSFDQSFDIGSYTLSLSVADDHGDSIDAATSISLGLTSGAIDPSDDSDYFQFFAQAGTAYTIEVILDTHSDTVLTLYDSRGNLLDEDDDGGRDGGELMAWTAPFTGDYYVEVRSYDQSFDIGSYSLSLSVADDHGDSIDTATPISFGLTSGAIDPPGDLDFFGFSAQAGTDYTIEVILDTHSDTVLTLYDSRGNRLDEDDDGGRDGGEFLAWTAPFTGDYYVEVRSYYQSSDTGSYSLSLSVADYHGDSIDTATTISPGLTSGAIDPPGDLDFFGFSVRAGTAYIIEVMLDTHPDTVLTLYDSRGNWLDEDNDGGRDGGEFLAWTAPFTGDYYVEVRSFDESFGTGSYTLSLSIADDHGDSIDTASTISPGLTPSDDLDFFRFSAQTGTTYTIEVLLDSHPDTVLTLYDSRGNLLDENDDGRQGGGELLEWNAPSTGDYYVEVRSYYQSSDTGSYTLSLSPEIRAFDQHGDSLQTASTISHGLTTGAIDPSDDSDFFRFSAQAGTTYTIEVLLDSHPDTVLTLYDSRGNWLDENDDGRRGGGELLEWTAPSTGDHYVEVRSYYQSSDTGSYTLSLMVRDDHGDGDTPQTSTFISPGLTLGTIEPPNDLDYFRFSALAGTAYTIEVILDTHPDTVLTLYDSRGNRLAENDDASDLLGGSRLRWTAPSTGDFYIEVRSFAQSLNRGSYILSLSVADDHGNSIQAATPISEGLTLGTIDPASDEDYFKFSAQGGATYTIEVQLDTHPDTKLVLYDSLGNRLAENDDASDLLGGSRLGWIAPSTGDYFLKVISFNTFTQTGSYRLVLEVTSPPTPLSGSYLGTESSYYDGISGEFQLVVEEMDGIVTGSVQNSPHHFGSGLISFGAFSGEFLVFETAFNDRADRWECTYTADRQSDQQTLIGEYSCFLVGSTVTDSGSWSVTRIPTQ